CSGARATHNTRRPLPASTPPPPLRVRYVVLSWFLSANPMKRGGKPEARMRDRRLTTGLFKNDTRVMRGKRRCKERKRTSEERSLMDIEGRRLRARLVCQGPGWPAGSKKLRIQLAISNDAWGRLRRFAFAT